MSLIKDWLLASCCRVKGHFKRECPKPPQQGNRYPFNRIQTPNNTKRAMVSANNTNCDWSVQFDSSGRGGTSCYAEVVKNVGDGDSLGMMTV
ncbi:putative transcription factor interactor and regulator CCHC(Zn) family [Helianthus anomalus]